LRTGLPDVVELDDVLAAHLAQAAALSDEPLPDLRVEAVVLGENLHHHLVLQPLVTGSVHSGEGTDPDHLTEPVVADLACRCCHPPVSGSARAAATSARPRAICAFTVPSGRPSRSAISWSGRLSQSRSTTASRSRSRHVSS